MKKNKKLLKLLIVTGISLVVWILGINFGGINYQANDDTIMNMIAAGAYGEGSQYLICSGIIIGRLIKAAYSVFPYVNCYLWTYLIISLIAVISIAVVISDEFDLLGTAVTAVLVNLFFASDFYINLQFSKNAALYAGAGFFLLLSYLYRGSKEWGRLLVASFLFLISYSVRKEGFFFLLPFGLVALVVLLVPLIKKNGSMKVLLPLLVPLFSVLLSLGANYVTFALDPDWKEYYDRDMILTAKRDFGNYNFEWNKEEYLEAGFTEWDFRLLDIWYYNDVDNFSLDKIKLMEKIGQSTRVDRIRIDGEVIQETFEVIRDAFKEGPLAAATIVIILLSLIFCIRKKNYLGLLGVVALAGGIFLECYYLACVRRALWRVEYGSWLAGALMSLGITVMPQMRDIVDGVKSSFARKKAVQGGGDDGAKGSSALEKATMAAIVVATGVAAFVWQGNNLDYNYDNNAYTETHYYDLFQAINKTDKFFVVSIDEMYGGFCGARNLMEMDRRYAGLYSNVTAAGNYLIPSPIGMYYAHQRGISNVFGSLADRDDMYYIGGGERMGYILMYINEKYGPGIDVYQEQFDGFEAWKFYRTGT